MASAATFIIAAIIAAKQVNVARQQNTGNKVTTESHPKKKKKKKFNIATWIALASAAISIIAAIIAAEQVNVAKQQNIAAEQQQLFTLTTTIAHVFNQPTPSTSNGQIGNTVELTADGEAAAALITQLHGNGVVDIEYEEVAAALDFAGETARAIAYYQAAASAPPYNREEQATAIREEGDLYYRLGRPIVGHDYFMRAVKRLREWPEVAQFVKDNNIAQTYLLDAQDELNFNRCTIASADIKIAKQFLSQGGGKNVTNAQLLRSDLTYSKNSCRGRG